MARPPQTAPPVQQSAVARRSESIELVRYKELVEAFQRPDRHAEIVAFMGSEDLATRFEHLTFVAMQRSPDLLRDASLPSLIQAVKDSASMGLEPTGLTGEGWIICYGATAVFIPGWRGYLKRIRNSGLVKGVTTDVVYRNDEFDYGRNTDGFWYAHHPAQTIVDPTTGEVLVSRGDYKSAFAFVPFINGFNDGEVMSVPEINKVRDDHSSSYGRRKSPWDTDYGEMMRKTVLKRIAKRLPQSAGVEALLMADAEADRIRDEMVGQAGASLNISRPQRAALAAIAKASGRELPALTEGEPVKEPLAQNVLEGVTEAGVAAALATTQPLPEEPEDFDTEEPELPI